MKKYFIILLIFYSLQSSSACSFLVPQYAYMSIYDNNNGELTFNKEYNLETNLIGASCEMNNKLIINDDNSFSVTDRDGLITKYQYNNREIVEIYRYESDQYIKLLAIDNDILIYGEVDTYNSTNTFYFTFYDGNNTEVYDYFLTDIQSYYNNNTFYTMNNFLYSNLQDKIYLNIQTEGNNTSSRTSFIYSFDKGSKQLQLLGKIENEKQVYWGDTKMIAIKKSNETQLFISKYENFRFVRLNKSESGLFIIQNYLDEESINSKHFVYDGNNFIGFPDVIDDNETINVSIIDKNDNLRNVDIEISIPAKFNVQNIIATSNFVVMIYYRPDSNPDNGFLPLNQSILVFSLIVLSIGMRKMKRYY